MEKPRLDSWKEIARHLKRDVRTVARWERLRGLPVYRVPGGTRSHVFAYPDELDAWLAGGHADGASEGSPSPIDTPAGGTFRAGHLLSGVVVGAILVGGVWLWTMRALEAPKQLAIVGNALVATDAAGHSRWTHEVAANELRAPAARWSYLGDFDDDGRDDVLATVEVTGSTLDQRGAALLRLSHDGALEWTARLDDHFAFRGAEYGPPWSARGLSLYRAGGAARIGWLVHHFTWWPGLFVTFDTDGRRVGTFVNSGWIQEVHPSPDDRYLFLTGVTNSRRAYFLAVLDAGNPNGHSPEPPGSFTECLSCPAGAPLRYFVFPRSDVGLNQPFPADGPSLHTFADGTVQLQTHESQGPNIPATVYNLTPQLSLERVGFSDSYWDWHRQLEQEHKLDHRADACPQRAGVDVQRWTRTDGWTTVRVPVR